MGRYYNLMIVPDGVESPFGIKIKTWLFKSIIVAFSVFMVALILFFIFYGKIVSRALMADRLEQENAELKLYKYKVGLLEERMKEARKLVTRISSLAGVDIEIPELPPDSVIFAALDSIMQPAIMTRSITALPDIPQGLPLRGFMTRGYIDDEENFHPGIDIAVDVGTPVLATASGKVSFVGEDSVYGLMVVIEHADNISTLYGHNRELLVEGKQEVLVGGRIALSGNTGKSSAPHLHYEIRENNIPVNPLRYIEENEEYEESN